MRISTAQIYQQGINAMETQQAKLQKTELQISSGLRIMKPSDDPAGAVKVLNLTSNIDVIDQFSRNIAVAESSLAFEESVVDGVNNSLQRIRELVVQANNATNHDEARSSIGQEINQRLDELLAMANTRDASGEYIFGGYNVGAPPFVETNGNVAYLGDQGQRLVQIGQSSQVAIRDSGESVFQRIPTGDGNIQVRAAVGNTGNAVIGAFGVTGSFTPGTYTVTFNQTTPSDPVTYTVTDGATPANVITPATNYVDGGSIGFAGAQFVVAGVPENGDIMTLSPSKNQDLFSTIRNIATALTTPTPDSASKAKFHNAMAEGLANLDQSLTNINNIRSGIGARLNNIESLDSINQDFKLQLQTVLSETQDLDFAEAIARFKLQITSLQAAQQAFAKTAGLSLFQYI